MGGTHLCVDLVGQVSCEMYTYSSTHPVCSPKIPVHEKSLSRDVQFLLHWEAVQCEQV